MGKQTAPGLRRAATRGITVACVVGMLVAVGPPASQAAAWPYGYRPLALQRAYGFQPLYAAGYTGKGQTIAFVEIDGFDPVDLALFTRQYRLPPALVTRYNYDGHTGTYRTGQRGLRPGPEATMDLEWAHALAPGARLAVYEVPQPTVAALAGQERLGNIRDALAAAVSRKAGVLSLSLGAGGLSCLTVIARLVLSDLFDAAGQRNMAVFASSGDSGEAQSQCGGGTGTSYPASDPHVTAVGGTTLRLGTGVDARQEIAWSGSGGGLNTSFRRAGWQYGPGLPAGPARGLPDVAFLADPFTGASVAFKGQWRRFGGTSLGAPCWAALWAIALQYAPRLSRPTPDGVNGLLYTVARGASGRQAFHDITKGDNGRYQAGPGWDFVTGWGTPDAAQLVYALARLTNDGPQGR